MANLKDLMGEDEVKIDDYVGTVIGNLTVVGWNGRHGNPNKYIVSCSVCREDNELHGEGLFAMSKGHLVRGCIPCGCTDKCNWSEEQYKVRVSMACIERGLIFKGWYGEFTTANKTKVIAECPEHGEFWSMTISYFLIKGGYKGCAGCFALRMGDYKRKDDSVMIETFMASGGYSEGTIFTRSERVNKHGHLKYWYMDCPDCGERGEGHIVGLYKGSRSCACTYQRPQETYINLLYDNENIVAIKFGVANIALERIKHQDQTCIYKVVNHGVWVYPTVAQCRKAERTCMHNLETGVVSKLEMPDGYTETTYPYNIDSVIEIFERCGGIQNI